ncbi:hypothetical protein SAMN02745857_03798 [Andreprevotia lacus DSM 23236]|jgi:hypothetical protein|uniref:Uncharacterized protein n=1 Tax=Andreprevotia lacus DSM 23236 TaxID=1121001 RepID=A0A1W1XZS1_9NEIS|nr:hypothetical protein [Andreprevotia lacus]SMC29382.1 hypothetical protein SAMN02745857_03798 [Andreprevotia lacus DSM 23236]
MEIFETRKSYVAMALITLPAWTLGGLFVGVVTSFGLTEDGSWPLFWIGASLPLVCILLFTRFIVKKTKSMHTDMAAGILTPTTDYFHNTNVSAIAVDVRKRLITVHLLPKKNRKKGPQKFEFSIDKIKRYSAYQSGSSEYASRDYSPIHQTHAFAKTAISEADAINNTGLTLQLDDIFTPELFVRMDYDAARKWFLLFDKLAEGSLDVQPTAVFFPK